MIRAALLLPLVLAGCATTASMRDKAPFFTGQTAKARDQVAGCTAVA